MRLYLNKYNNNILAVPFVFVVISSFYYSVGHSLYLLYMQQCADYGVIAQFIYNICTNERKKEKVRKKNDMSSADNKTNLENWRKQR
jgi:hypothetical protein